MNKKRPIYKQKGKGGSLCLEVQDILGSNHSTGYEIDIFQINFFADKIVLFVWKDRK